MDIDGEIINLRRRVAQLEVAAKVSTAKIPVVDVAESMGDLTKLVSALGDLCAEIGIEMSNMKDERAALDDRLAKIEARLGEAESILSPNYVEGETVAEKPKELAAERPTEDDLASGDGKKAADDPDQARRAGFETA